MSSINANEMPVPRLELRWIKAGETWETRECVYALVLPLKEADIRRENKDGSKNDVLTVEIGRTKVTGGGGPYWEEEDCVDTPFRDGCHAQWDGAVLGLPTYAVFENRATKVLPGGKL